MGIKVDQLCGLSTSAAWQAWLYRYSPAIYQELAEHLRVSRGCSHNQEKMRELIAKIGSMPGGWDSLTEFVNINFPHMIERPAVMTPVAMDVPFENCDHRLLTFPRRAILQNDNVYELQNQVRELLRNNARYDAVIIGDRAFVEYVPGEHRAIADSIPEKSWLVTKWKKGRGIK